MGKHIYTVECFTKALHVLNNLMADSRTIRRSTANKMAIEIELYTSYLFGEQLDIDNFADCLNKIKSSYVALFDVQINNRLSNRQYRRLELLAKQADKFEWIFYRNFKNEN